MLRKKLISLSLVGITIFGTITSNTAIVLAAPTKTEASHNMIQGETLCGMTRYGMMTVGMYRLEKLINEGNYESAINWQKQLKNYLEFLKKTGEDITYFQKKFDKVSNQLDLLKLDKPTNAESSDNNMIQAMIRNVMYNLEKFINEGNYESAVIWQSQLKNHINVLSKTGENITELQKEFDKLSNQLDLLKFENN